MSRVVARIPSLRIPGASYDVELRADATLACSCPAWGCSRSPKDCKHLRLYRFAVGALERCRARHRGADGWLCAACLLAILAAVARKHAPKRAGKKKR